MNMKGVFILTAAMCMLFYSCNSTENEEAKNETEDVVAEEVKPIKGCETFSVEDFDKFLGVRYGTHELNLERRLGKFTGGEYTQDSSSFIYYYNRVDRVPISVWVNAKSGKVQTIFMEVLSYTDINFESDLRKAKQEFEITDCDISWFGIYEKDVQQRLGEPAISEYLEDSVKSVSYDSEDYLYSVNFKFYPSQKEKCSSISINWFY